MSFILNIKIFILEMAKHLINKTENWAKDSLKGYLLANNQNLIALEEFPNVISRRDYLTLEESNSRVALISGGGSGHEPAHLGFVGHGMLTAVVCGDLFASPSTAAILAAIRLVGRANKAGVLMIVKNYTGDRLNFGLAAKRAQLEGINVDWVLVDDDVALLDSQSERDNSVGRRGLCGTVLIHKIAGALAEQRKSLKEIKETLDFILKGNYLKTIGVSLSGSVPLPGDLSEKKLDSQIEIGLGIHGEAGRHKVELTKSKELVNSILKEYLFKETNLTEVCLMVNNLGGLSNLELSLLANDCTEYLAEFCPNVKLARLYVGTFMSSLNMNGFSITLLNLEESHKDNILSLLDSNTNAPAWPKTFGKDVKSFEYLKGSFGSLTKSSNLISNQDYIQYGERMAKMLEFFLKNIAEDLISFKDHLNKLDSEVGDGDCGNSLSAVSERILKDIKEGNKFSFKYPHQVVLHLSEIFEAGGGSLCILLSLFMSAGAKAFQRSCVNFQNENEPIFWLRMWKNAVENGTKAVQEYGRAKPGQRSIVDPLTAIINYLDQCIKVFEERKQLDTKTLLKQLVDVTYNAAQETATMKPRVGRASYVDANIVKSPDAGAVGVSSVTTSIYKAFLIFINE